MELVASILAGDMRALGRGIRLVEEGDPAGRDLLRRIMPETGGAHRVGVTGPPGVGKSTLVAALVAEARRRGRRVGVLAVDPTSPYTGGALLGDRIRLRDHFLDDGVFMRSMATRGAAGGMSARAGEALDLMDAAGFGLLLVETAGAGQTDLAVVEDVETTVLVLAPGAGDGIQAMKAGLLEVADLWVVNKADTEGAEALCAELVASLEMGGRVPDAGGRVLTTCALRGEGTAALLDRVDARLAELEAGGTRGDRRRRNLLQRLRGAVHRRVEALLPPGSADVDHLLQRILDGGCTVEEAAEELLARRIPPQGGEVRP